MSRLAKSFALFLLFAGLLLGATNASALICTSGAGAVNWSAAATWTSVGNCNRVPLAGDVVVIAAGSTTTLDVNSNSLASLTVNGTLTIGNNATARAMTVTGGTTVAGTFSVGATAATHTLTAGGNITNTGTINFAPSATRVCNVTFNNNGNQTVSGAGAYTFNLITLNMGATNANILDMQSPMTVPAGFLTITNGTYKHSNTSNITPWAAAVTIPASGGFWLNGAATVTTTGFNMTVTGLFRISAGTMTIGNANTTQLILNNASTFQMDGGALTVTGGLGSAAVGSTGTFTMSGGTINVQTISAGTPTSFILGSGTTFNMSGGTIVLVNGDAATWDMDVRSGTQNISGGTVQIGSGATTAANNFAIANGGGGTLSLWNLTHAAGVARSNTLGSAVNVLNNLTIQANNTLVAGAFTHSVGGNWSNSGVFTAGTSTVTFTGTNSTLGGSVATTFNNLTINKTAGNNVSIVCGTPSPTVNATLALTSGDIITSGTSPACATDCASQVPIIVAAAGTITGGSATSYVQGALRKMFAAGTLNFRLPAGQDDFPVGDATNYTPVEITAGTTSTAGSVTACVTPTDHPQVTTPVATTGIDAAKSVNRYWSLTTATINTTTVPVDATFKFVAGDVDVGATTANFIVEDWNGTNWSPTTLFTAAATSTRAQNIDLTSTTNDIAIGEPLLGLTALPGQFNAFETTTPAGAVLGMVQTKQSGVALSVRLVRLNVAKNAVDTTYTQAGVTVELLDSSDNTGALNAITGCRPIGAAVGQWHPIAGTSQLVNFNLGVISPVSFTVANAYRDVRVHIVKTLVGAGEGCSTDRFAIRPTSITVTAHDATWATAGTGRPLANTGASGGNVHKAATAASPLPFTLRATPLPATATNYDGTPTSVAGFPTCGGLCTTVGGLSFTPGSWTAAGSGVRENATANYSEAGTFNLQLEDASYASVDAVDGSTSAMRTVPATASAQIGRFVPDHFDVTGLITPIFKTFNATDAACSAGAAPRRTFTYIGQPFGYLTAPQATIFARNAAGGTTVNYSGTLWKIGGTSSFGKDCTTDPNICQFTTSWTGGGNSSSVIESYAYSLTPVSTPGWDNASATTAAATVTPGAGTGTIAISSSNTLAFLRNTTTPQAAFTANITDTIGVQDASENAVANNGIISTATPLVFNGAGSGIDFDGGGASNGKEFRYGRLRLSNALGSELLNLPIPVQTQYWNGVSFMTNTADNCTTLAANNIKLTAPPAGVSATVGGAFTSGVGSLTLTKPTTPAKVAVDLCVDLGADPVGGTVCSATSASLPYLQGLWSPGTSYNNDPGARATFGAYKGSNEFIYLRENY